MPIRATQRRGGLTLLELVLSIALIAALLSILLPALSTARSHSFRDRCHENQRQIGVAWEMYLQDHNDQFPFVPMQPGWFYGGARFSAVYDSAFPDQTRPLTPYVPTFRDVGDHEIVWCCPADRGIKDPELNLGTGRRTAFRSFGTSYRANSAILNHLEAPASASRDRDGDSGTATPATRPPPFEARSLHRNEITTAPSRLVLGGDAVWYEVAESTRLHADWHNEPDAGNILFLDGSVRFVTVRPREIIGPVVFDPMMPGSVPMPQPAANPE